MEENLKNISKNILNIIDNKTKNLNNKTKLMLGLSILIFIISKLLSLFKINIPGLGILPITLLSIVVALESFKRYKESKQKIYLILGSITSGIGALFLGCLIIVYPFIIASKILL